MSQKPLPSRWNPTPNPPPAGAGSTSWNAIGPGKEHLAQEVENLYWQGARDELENIVRTLKIWQDPEYATLGLAEDDDEEHIHGYDTFIDQVNKNARAFATRYREARVSYEGLNGCEYTSYEKAIEAVTVDTIAELGSSRIKAEVRRNLTTTTKHSGVEEKVRLLLQTAGFLDIDQLIENRPGQQKAGKRPGVPQLTAHGRSKGATFQVLKCRHCSKSITGSMFTRGKETFASSTICEPCHWAHHYGDKSFVKRYKHSVVEDAIELADKQKACPCFQPGEPMDPQYLTSVKGHDHSSRDASTCPLPKIRSQIAQAKYDGLLATARVASLKKKPSSVTRMVTRLKRQSTIGESVPRSKKEQAAIDGSTSAGRALADEDVPLFFRHCVEQHPFDYLQVALRLGPVVIQNGVSGATGAFITLRDLPVYHERLQIRGSFQRALCVGPEAERKVSHRPLASAPKHYKLTMKQVVGVPFSGILPETSEQGQLEQEIVKLLVDSIDLFEPGSEDEQRKALNAIIDPILLTLQSLLSSRVKIYVTSIAGRLLDPTTNITWKAGSNNCLTFCSSLLDPALFGPLVNGPKIPELASPLYLMSFVCPTAHEYPHQRIANRFEVPYGFTEEYLHRFWFGRFNDADIIDSLQEYWYDWGSFSGPLYKNQDMFPWDCSEAYKSCPTKCGDCNMAKHVWAFPFDTWSIITLHLQREQHLYPPPSSNSTNNPTDTEWVKSRYSILTASSILNRVATAMAQSPRFIKASTWLHPTTPNQQTNPPSSSLARFKLGGIHRAQPFSHAYESAPKDHYFLANWALDSLPVQQKQYEILRDNRMAIPDIPDTQASGPRYKSAAYRDDYSSEYFGFLGTRPDYQYKYSGGASNYYPYYYATTDTIASGDGGVQCADGQLGEVDRKAGDGNGLCGADTNCGSGCGAASHSAAMATISHGGGGG
ncbi:hypothetical protein BDW59DRAFT_164487, partial [Aspergillus cavernicola]